MPAAPKPEPRPKKRLAFGRTLAAPTKPIAHMSPKRRAYLASPQHDRAYSEREAYCVGHALGAPGRCIGILTPHHTLKRSQAGGIEAAEQYPVVTVCAWLNGAFESDPEARKWGETHTFVRGGVQYRFIVRGVADADGGRADDE